MPIHAMTRTPFGGMNQDDSLVTPAKDQAGNNAFQTGDYRYALNARIGSSRQDSFGDLENIRSTVEVTDYYGYEELFENGDFTGSPDDWSQLDEGPTFRTWVYGADYARISVVPNSVSPTLSLAVDSFSEPLHGGPFGWDPLSYTQANFLDSLASTVFHVGQTIDFIDTSTYISGNVVEVGLDNGGFPIVVFQQAFLGDDPAPSPKAVYGSGPPAYVATSFNSRILYQTVDDPIAGLSINLKFLLEVNAAVTDGELKLVFMNNDTIVGYQIVDSGVIGTTSFDQMVDIPEGVNGIGLRISGTVITPMDATLRMFTLSSSTFSQITRPTGNEIVIGRYEDYEFQRLYYCVYNDEDNHSVRYWDATQNIIVELVRWSGFNWIATTLVQMAKLDNWMALTDRRNPPRLMDVNSISALKANLGDDFREFHISFHKWAPIAPAIPRIYYDGVTNNYDRLKDKVYHFAYRYVYYGDLKSRWSPISKGAATVNITNNVYTNRTITSIEVDVPGFIFDDPNASSTAYNYFDHTDIKFTSAVKYIELAFRDGELELWKLWKRVPVNAAFNRFQYFNGEGLLTPLSREDFDQQFDTVPFLAGAVEAIDNRFVFGDILEEKPPVTDLQIDEVGSVRGLDEWNNARANSFSQFSGNATARERLQRLNGLSNLTFKDRCLYKAGIQFLYPTGWRTGSYTSEDWLYNIDDVTGFNSGSTNLALNFKIPDAFRPPEGAIAYQIMRTNAINVSYYMFGIANKFKPVIDDLTDVTDRLNLSQSTKDKLAEHFRNVDNLSGDEVITETENAIQAEIDANAPRDRRIRRRNRQLDRNTTFNFINSGVGHGLFTALVAKWGKRTPVGPALQQELRKVKEINLLPNASRIIIDINNWYFGALESTDKEYPLNNLFYNYTRGDRVRFVGSTVENPSTADQLQEFDVPIIEFTGKGLLIERPENLKWVSTTASNHALNNFGIEVYTPQYATEQDHIFYEMGEWYPILYPGTGDRDFAKRDFVYTDDSAVTLSQYGPFDIYHKMPLYFGDSYSVGKTVYKDKTPGGSQELIFMSMNPDINKTFDYWDKNNGRPSIAYEDLPVVRFKTTMARFSGKIVEESFVNNLNRMREEDQFVYPSEYGRIRAIVNTSNAQVESVGAILLFIGEREAWSTYVNRTTLEDLSGRGQVSLSDDVLGSYNTLLGSHGTLNPESVCKNRGRVWWWNAIKGAWIRYGRDGLTEISDYKMRNWFSDLNDLMVTKYQTSEQPVAISEFDPFNRELITYQHHSALPASFRGYDHFKGALFSEEDTRWKSIHNFTPELMGKMNNQVVMFKNGSPFLYEKNAEVASTFFGIKYDVMWEPVFNDEAHLKKAWRALAIVSTNRWAVDRILSEYRGIRQKQETTIPMNLFKEVEDNFYYEIRRDIHTPNTTNPEINGDGMKSKAIQVLMRLDPSVNYRSLLHYVMAEFTDSPKNP